MTNSDITPVMRDVCKRLKKIWHDRDFVIGAMTLLGTEENFQKMLNFLDSHEEATPDDIMEFVIFMDEDEKE